MSKSYIIDYLGYISLRLLGPIVRALPLGLSLFLGKLIGSLLYYFDLKHKALAYANIKRALGDELMPWQLAGLTKKFYQNFGQSLIDIFLIPKINPEYIAKYINIIGEANIAEGFKKGKGVIFLGVHAGSWELSNVICAHLGFHFSLFVRDQKTPKINKLLNSYRQQQGCKLIQRGNYARQLIQALKNNEAIGMTVDQGGKGGELIKFFGHEASIATGAVKLALKYNAVILPAFYTRLDGPYNKVIIEEAFQLKATGDKEADLTDNLQRLISIFEKLIIKYPEEYFWAYKIWKYALERNILILSDGKTGHLRQSQALTQIIVRLLAQRGIRVNVDTLEVEFKNRLTRHLLTLSSCLSDKLRCQGCLWCLSRFLKTDSYKSLLRVKPDIVVSCAASLAAVNFIISRENLAKSVVLLRPSLLSTKRFNLVIMPQHDRPVRRRNIVSTEGALNLIDDDYLENQRQRLVQSLGLQFQPSGFFIGLLIGGDTKRFHLKAETVLAIIRQIKSASRNLGAEILVTSSRRTAPCVEKILKEEFIDYPGCKLLLIAREKNIPEAVGGILGLAQIVVCSPESVSMISEAVNSKRQVIVFKADGLDAKHKRFISCFAENRYIYLVEPQEIAKIIEYIKLNQPATEALKDNFLVAEALRRIL